MIIFRTLDMLFNIIEILILVRVVSSYIPDIRGKKIFTIIHMLTEPILYPIRTLLNSIGLNMGTIDFSPIFAYLLLNIIRNIIFRII